MKKNSRQDSPARAAERPATETPLARRFHDARWQFSGLRLARDRRPR